MYQTVTPKPRYVPHRDLCTVTPRVQMENTVPEAQFRNLPFDSPLHNPGSEQHQQLVAFVPLSNTVVVSAATLTDEPAGDSIPPIDAGGKQTAAPDPSQTP